MKESDFDLNWPPPETGVLVRCSLLMHAMSNFTFQDNPIRRGYFILFWTIEDNQVIWKDSLHRNRCYEVKLEKWWNLDLST